MSRFAVTIPRNPTGPILQERFRNVPRVLYGIGDIQSHTHCPSRLRFPGVPGLWDSGIVALHCGTHGTGKTVR